VDEVKDILDKPGTGFPEANNSVLHARALAVVCIFWDCTLLALTPSRLRQNRRTHSHLKQNYTIVIVSTTCSSGRVSDETAFFLLGD